MIEITECMKAMKNTQNATNQPTCSFHADNVLIPGLICTWMTESVEESLGVGVGGTNQLSD